MSESETNRPVLVTADERIHPALKKLARACIMIARMAATSRLPQPTAATPSVPEPPAPRKSDT